MKISKIITNYVEAKQREDKDYVFYSEYNMPRYRNTDYQILVPQEYEAAVDNYDYSRSEAVKSVVIDNLTHITESLSMDFQKAESLCKDLALIVANSIKITKGEDIEGLDYFVKAEELTEIGHLEQLRYFVLQEYDGWADLESRTFEDCCNAVGITSNDVFDNFFGLCESFIEDELDRLLNIRGTSAKYNFANLEVDVDLDSEIGLGVLIYDPKG